MPQVKQALKNVTYPQNLETSHPQGKFVNDIDQEIQQNGVSKDGDDNDVLAEDKESIILEGEEDMLPIEKLGEGGDLEGCERIEENVMEWK